MLIEWGLKRKNDTKKDGRKQKGQKTSRTGTASYNDYKKKQQDKKHRTKTKKILISLIYM